MTALDAAFVGLVAPHMDTLGRGSDFIISFADVRFTSCFPTIAACLVPGCQDSLSIVAFQLDTTDPSSTPTILS